MPDAREQNVRECTRGGLWIGAASIVIGGVGVMLGHGGVGSILVLIATILWLCAFGALFAAALGGDPYR